MQQLFPPSTNSKICEQSLGSVSSFQKSGRLNGKGRLPTVLENPEFEVVVLSSDSESNSEAEGHVDCRIERISIKEESLNPESTPGEVVGNESESLIRLESLSGVQLDGRGPYTARLVV